MAYELTPLEKCICCGTEIMVRPEDTSVCCNNCHTRMGVSRFTKEEKRLAEVIDELSQRTDAQSSAIRSQIESLRSDWNTSLNGQLQELFRQGEDYQRGGRFDKAIERYQKVLVKSPVPESEIHWRILLCRYGIEYVREQSCGRALPTSTRMNIGNILEDEAYRSAVLYAPDAGIRAFYEDEAKRIHNLLMKYQQINGDPANKPYDVFISVKQGDSRGHATTDGYEALELYHELEKMGWKVFNSRTCLKQYSGTEYEPYIMHALATAKVMVVIASNEDYMNSPWVRNEWRRFRWLQENNECLPSENRHERRLIAYVLGNRKWHMPELGGLQIIRAASDSAPVATLIDNIRAVCGKHTESVTPVSPVPPVSPAANMAFGSMQGMTPEQMAQFAVAMFKQMQMQGMQMGGQIPPTGMPVQPVIPNPVVPDPIVPNPVVPDPVVPNPVIPNPAVPDPVVPAQTVTGEQTETHSEEAAGETEEEARSGDESSDGLFFSDDVMRQIGQMLSGMGREEGTSEGGQSEQTEQSEQAEQTENAEDDGALFAQGEDYYYGRGVAQDYSRAVQCFREAADMGNAEAQHMMGECCYLGQGVDQDYTEAVEWYRKSAEQGCAKGQNALGYCYNNGRGVEENKALALEWYRKAAAQGLAKAQNNVGNFYYYGEVVEEDEHCAFEWYTKSARQGYSNAQNKLGECYYYGRGVAQDHKKAVEWYRKAAEQDHASAQYMLGYCYWVGQGVAQNLKQAAMWYAKAADLGNARAQRALGFCCEKGKGVERDNVKAFELYLEAARQDDAEAQYRAGLCLQNGRGTHNDPTEALRWYRKAAAKGFADAVFAVGYCLENGVGTEKNVSAAIAEYEKAAATGHAAARKALERLKEVRGAGRERPAEQAAQSGLVFSEDVLSQIGSMFGGTGESGGQSERAQTPAAPQQETSDDWMNLAVQQIQSSAEGTSSEAGAQQNRESSAEDVQAAAERGDAQAQYKLGDRYYYGQGVEQSHQKAAFWYEKAARQGHSGAQCDLGYCYLNGYGVKRDRKKAVYWLHESAKQGNATAQNNLGRCYEKGVGVAANRQNALKWYRKAAERGNKNAAEAYERLSRTRSASEQVDALFH